MPLGWYLSLHINLPGIVLTTDCLQEQRFAQMNKWIKPPDSASVLHKELDLREEGTCYWIFEHPAFRAWEETKWENCQVVTSKSFGPRVLWIRGMLNTSSRCYSIH